MRQKLLFLSFLVLSFYFFLALGMLSPVFAATPVGNIDFVDGTTVSGWATDPDIIGPITVHIYIDGKMQDYIKADDPSTDVGAHRFEWIHPPYGWGNHEVRVYAIGVGTNGQPNGENPELSPGAQGNPKRFDVGCAGLVGGGLDWCQNNGGYWYTRQADTKLLFNDYIRIGINNSYGGLITLLSSNDRRYNLIDEHGGSAIQLSLYEYDLSHGNTGAWFGTDGCDGTKYTTEAACKAVHAACNPRGAAYGDHAADCVTVRNCNSVDPGWPWNPIQAQGINCSWDDPSNDVDFSAPFGNGWKIRLDDPANYSKTTLFTGMHFDQEVTLGDIYAKVHYTMTYSGPYTQLNYGDQEIPAFFTNAGINRVFYYYNKPTTFTNGTVERRVLDPGKRFLASPNFNLTDRTPYDAATEYWWGVCNASEDQCVTLAAFDSVIQQFSIDSDNFGGGGYLGMIGQFKVEPAMHQDITLYVFPYRWDKVIGGKSVRQRIYELAAEYGIGPTPTPSPTPSPSPSYTKTQLKAALSNYKGTADSTYWPVDGKINMLDAGYVINWLH